MRIILTGGGTAGHVTPNIALLPSLKQAGFEISYIGSYNGIEKGLIQSCGIPYYGISSGKLRRYLSKENAADVFRVCKGFSEAGKLMKALKPDIVFSKGGFVGVPVVVAAKLHRIPVVIHESDITPGLANRISSRFAKKICVSFPETLKYVSPKKSVLTGTPIRKEILEGSREKGLALCGFSGQKPVLLFMGGSLGSVTLNSALRQILPELTETFDIVHLCGKGNLSDSRTVGYKQFEYLSDELRHIFAVSDAVISRAGSNSIFEFLALRKPNLLVPLSKKASRGDQIDNAESFKLQGFSAVLLEEDLTAETLLASVKELYANRDRYIAKMSGTTLKSSIKEVTDVIVKNCKSRE